MTAVFCHCLSWKATKQWPPRSVDGTHVSYHSRSHKDAVHSGSHTQNKSPAIVVINEDCRFRPVRSFHCCSHQRCHACVKSVVAIVIILQLILLLCCYIRWYFPVDPHRHCHLCQKEDTETKSIDWQLRSCQHLSESLGPTSTTGAATVGKCHSERMQRQCSLKTNRVVNFHHHR